MISGQIDIALPETIIWEFPYTENPTASALRQMLGALRASYSTEIAAIDVTATDSKATFDMPLDATGSNLLYIRLDTVEAQKLSVDVYFSDDSKKTVQLRRKSALAANGQYADWWADLSGFEQANIVSLRLRFDSNVPSQTARVAFMATPQI